jgi:hypothetical protein
VRGRRSARRRRELVVGDAMAGAEAGASGGWDWKHLGLKQRVADLQLTFRFRPPLIHRICIEIM